MTGKWSQALAPGSAVAVTFERLLRERIDKDFEVTDELVEHIVNQLRQFRKKQELLEDLTDVFEEAAGPISDWCWDTLEDLTSGDKEPPEPSTPAESTDGEVPAAEAPGEEGEVPAAEAPLVEPQDAQQAKRAPIRFNLDQSPQEDAPRRASEQKAQQLGGRQPAAAEPVPQQAPKHAPADVRQQPAAAATAERGSRHDTSRSRERSGAPAARLVGGALRSLLPGSERSSSGHGKGSRASRERSSQRQHQQQQREERSSQREQQHEEHEQHRQQQRQERDEHHRQQRKPEQPAGHQEQAQQQERPQRKRALEPDQAVSEPAGRTSAAVKRSTPGGPRSLLHNAIQGLEKTSDTKSAAAAEERSPQKDQKQQQQQPRVTVFDRLNWDGATGASAGPQQQQQQQRLGQRLGQRPQPGNQEVEKQPAAVKEPQPQQLPVQQRLEQLQGLPKSLQGRLGFPGRPSQAAGPAAGNGSSSGKQQVQPKGPAPVAVSSAAGSKRKEAPAADTAAATAPAAASAAGTAAAASAEPKGVAQGRQVTVQHQEAGAAKKARLAAPAAPTAAPPAAAAGTAAADKPGTTDSSSSRKAAELAALKMMLKQREAEVERLKQAQDADARSVVVFGVSPVVPDSVVQAHFGHCGRIKRCTLLPGRMTGASLPGAYIEFEDSPAGSGRSTTAQQAVAAAQRLSGSLLLDQKITVTRKSEWQASQAKGQRSFTARRAAAAQPTGPGSRSWKGTTGPAASPSPLQPVSAAGVPPAAV